ncbi:hypothetical protein ACLKA7_012305 [Drosophila subpalustris]
MDSHSMQPDAWQGGQGMQPRTHSVQFDCGRRLNSSTPRSALIASISNCRAELWLVPHPPGDPLWVARSDDQFEGQHQKLSVPYNLP